MYALIRTLLFCLPTEISHGLTLQTLRVGNAILPEYALDRTNPVQLMGLSFPNRVGLAAGLDKNGDYIDALGRLGFGFIEIGTITPKPQPGNAKPRLFRLPEEKALINRMGFNNKGAQYLCDKAQKRHYKGILGINIGKNAKTPLNQAHEDYLFCLKAVYPYADYITINISSPNTENLRDLQQNALLTTLLELLKKEQLSLAMSTQRYVPLVVKISPDLSNEQISSVAHILLHHEIDGVIATNTLLHKQGGLSGKPLTQRSTEVIRQLALELKGKIPIIGVGGIMKPQDALDKINAGASLVQLYTGLIYQGPQLVKDCLNILR